MGGEGAEGRLKAAEKVRGGAQPQAEACDNMGLQGPFPEAPVRAGFSLTYQPYGR